MKKKVIKKIKPEIKVGKKEDISKVSLGVAFETTDKELVSKLVAKGFIIKEVKSPFGDRKEKLYVFQESESKVKEVLNG